MAFLPANNIEKISNTLTKLLKENNVIDDYEILSINSKITNNPKTKMKEFSDKIYDIYLSDTKSSIKNELENIEFNNSLTNEEYHICSYCNVTSSKKSIKVKSIITESKIKSELL
jgi:hypothetical protein